MRDILAVQEEFTQQVGLRGVGRHEAAAMKRDGQPVVAVRVEEGVDLRKQCLKLIGEFGHRGQHRLQLGLIECGDSTCAARVPIVTPPRDLVIAVRQCQHMGRDLLHCPIVARRSGQRVRGANEAIKSLVCQRNSIS